MNWRRPGGTLVVLIVATAIGGLTVSLLTSNDLFFSSDQATAALASLVFVLLVLALFVVLGRPWMEWDRTPYW